MSDIKTCLDTWRPFRNERLSKENVAMLGKSVPFDDDIEELMENFGFDFDERRFEQLDGGTVTQVCNGLEKIRQEREDASDSEGTNQRLSDEEAQQHQQQESQGTPLITTEPTMTSPHFSHRSNFNHNTDDDSHESCEEEEMRPVVQTGLSEPSANFRNTGSNDEGEVDDDDDESADDSHHDDDNDTDAHSSDYPRGGGSDNDLLFRPDHRKVNRKKTRPGEMENIPVKDPINLDAIDLEAFTTILTDNKDAFELARKKDVLIPIGFPGAGKSFYVQVMLGIQPSRKTIRDKDGGRTMVWHFENPVENCEVKDASDHVTVTVSALEDHEHGYTLMNVPGMDQTGDGDINFEIATAISIRRVLQDAKSALLVLVIDARALQSSRGLYIKSFAHVLQRVFGQTAEASRFVKCMPVVFTHVSEMKDPKRQIQQALSSLSKSKEIRRSKFVYEICIAIKDAFETYKEKAFVDANRLRTGKQTATHLWNYVNKFEPMKSKTASRDFGLPLSKGTTAEIEKKASACVQCIGALVDKDPEGAFRQFHQLKDLVAMIDIPSLNTYLNQAVTLVGDRVTQVVKEVETAIYDGKWDIVGEKLTKLFDMSGSEDEFKTREKFEALVQDVELRFENISSALKGRFNHVTSHDVKRFQTLVDMYVGLAATLTDDVKKEAPKICVAIQNCVRTAAERISVSASKISNSWQATDMEQFLKDLTTLAATQTMDATVQGKVGFLYDVNNNYKQIIEEAVANQQGLKKEVERVVEEFLHVPEASISEYDTDRVICLFAALRTISVPAFQHHITESGTHTSVDVTPTMSDVDKKFSASWRTLMKSWSENCENHDKVATVARKLEIMLSFDPIFRANKQPDFTDRVEQHVSKVAKSFEDARKDYDVLASTLGGGDATLARRCVAQLKSLREVVVLEGPLGSSPEIKKQSFNQRRKALEDEIRTESLARLNNVRDLSNTDHYEELTMCWNRAGPLVALYELYPEVQATLKDVVVPPLNAHVKMLKSLKFVTSDSSLDLDALICCFVRVDGFEDMMRKGLLLTSAAQAVKTSNAALEKKLKICREQQQRAVDAVKTRVAQLHDACLKAMENLSVEQIKQSLEELKILAGIKYQCVETVILSGIKEVSRRLVAKFNEILLLSQEDYETVKGDDEHSVFLRNAAKKLNDLVPDNLLQFLEIVEKHQFDTVATFNKRLPEMLKDKSFQQIGDLLKASRDKNKQVYKSCDSKIITHLQRIYTVFEQNTREVSAVVIEVFMSKFKDAQEVLSIFANAMDMADATTYTVKKSLNFVLGRMDQMFMEMENTVNSRLKTHRYMEAAERYFCLVQFGSLDSITGGNGQFRTRVAEVKKSFKALEKSLPETMEDMLNDDDFGEDFGFDIQEAKEIFEAVAKDKNDLAFEGLVNFKSIYRKLWKQIRKSAAKLEEAVEEEAKEAADQDKEPDAARRKLSYVQELHQLSCFNAEDRARANQLQEALNGTYDSLECQHSGGMGSIYHGVPGTGVYNGNVAPGTGVYHGNATLDAGKYSSNAMPSSGDGFFPMDVDVNPQAECSQLVQLGSGLKNRKNFKRQLHSTLMKVKLPRAKVAHAMPGASAGSIEELQLMITATEELRFWAKVPDIEKKEVTDVAAVVHADLPFCQDSLKKTIDDCFEKIKNADMKVPEKISRVEQLLDLVKSPNTVATVGDPASLEAVEKEVAEEHKRLTTEVSSMAKDLEEMRKFSLQGKLEVKTICERMDRAKKFTSDPNNPYMQEYTQIIEKNLQQVVEEVEDLWKSQQYTKIGATLENIQKFADLTGKKKIALQSLTFQEAKEQIWASLEVCIELTLSKMQKVFHEKNFAVLNTQLKTLSEVDETISKHLPVNKQGPYVAIFVKSIDDILCDMIHKAGYIPKDDDVRLAKLLVKLQECCKDITNNDIQQTVKAKMKDLLQQHEAVEGNFLALGGCLSDEGAFGQEVMEMFADMFRAKITMLINAAKADMSLTDLLKEMKKNQPGGILATGGNIGLDQSEKDVLIQLYDGYKTKYDGLLEEYLQPKKSLDDLVTDVKTTVASLLEKATGYSDVRVQLPDIIAGIFAYWTVHMSKDAFAKHSDQMVLMRPHALQVVALFRLLGVDSKSKLDGFPMLQRIKKICTKSKLKGRLLEVATGNGKSILLGTLSVLLALLGFDVSCACYSAQLSQRDFQGFKFMFEAFGVTEYIRYSQISKLANNLVNRRGYVRKITKNFLMGEKFTTNDKDGIDRPPIIIIDECDVLLDERIHGTTYNPVTTITNPQVVAIIRHIWSNRRSKTLSVESVKKQCFYKELVEGMNSQCEPIFEACVEKMIRDAKIKLSPYELKKTESGMKIGYKEFDGINTDTFVGYHTAFSYLAEEEKGTLTATEVDENLSMVITAGQFSFAELPKHFDAVIGVSGTLSCLSEESKKILSEYKITSMSYLPSIYGGDTGAKFLPHLDVEVLMEQSAQHMTIAKKIQDCVTAKRAVITFFRDEQEIQAFLKSEYGSKFDLNHVNIITETTKESEIPYLVNKATRSKAITLAVRVFGRGTDFKCHDATVNTRNGVHVIQTFLSDDYSEEIQIRGRAGRQSNPGTFELVLFGKLLISQLEVTDADLLEKMKGNVYDFLHEKRLEKFKEAVKKLQKAAEKAKDRHAMSMEYLEACLSSNPNDETIAAKLLALQ